MFSSILELIQKIQEGKLRKQKKETKKIVREKEDKLNKENDNNIVQSKDAAQKSPEAQQSKEEEKKLNLKVWAIRIFKWCLEILESFVVFMVSIFGVMGFFIVLVVVVLMIAIYGLLHLDMDAFNSDFFQGVDEYQDCIQGSEVLSQSGYDLNSMGSLMGTFTEYEKNLFRTLSLYHEVLNSNDAFASNEKMNNIKNVLGTDKLANFLFGFSATETGMQFNNDDKDVLEYPSKIEKNSAGYAFLGLHYDNIFDGTYRYNGLSNGLGTRMLTESFVSNWKSKYIPKETPIYDNNFVPYGVATQSGAFATSYLGSHYDNVVSKFPAIMDKYGIKANRDKLVAFAQLFAGAGYYHTDKGSVNENVFSLWCALWSATSEIDSNRSFDHIKIIYDNGYRESSARPYIVGSGGDNITYKIGQNMPGYFKINGEEISTTLWEWVANNCSNKEYFNETALVWLNEYSGSTLILNGHYGLLAYLMGNKIVEDLGGAAPVTSGGSVEDCECYEVGVSSNVGEIDITTLQKGVIQGDWPEDVKKKMESYGWTQYFGYSYATDNPNAKLSSTGQTFEEWRQGTKWKVPYQSQYMTSLEPGRGVVKQGSINYGNSCHVYMSSYIASALTGKFINLPEMFAALRATGGTSFGYFCNTKAYVTFEKLGIYWSGMKSDGTMVKGSSKSDCPQIYPEGNTVQEKVNAVLDAGGIVGVSTETGHYTSSGHYFVITERNGDKYKTYSASKPANDLDWHTFDYIVGSGKIGDDLRRMADGTSFWFAYKPTGVVSTVSKKGSKEVSIPSSVSQTGLIADYTNYTYFYSQWSNSTNQRKVADLWHERGRGNSKGIATIDGNYLVAVRPKFGSAGDALTIVLEDNTEINAIIGDVKGSDAAEWGHLYSGSYSLIEWEAFGTDEGSTSGVNIDLGDWKNKKVNKIINHGSYLKDSNIFSFFNPKTEIECVPIQGSNSDLPMGTANASETEEERWKRAMGEENYNKYFENVWKGSTSARDGRKKWNDFKAVLENNMVEAIQVKAWDLDSSGNWYSYDFEILVNKNLSSAIKGIMNELYALPEDERTPIKKALKSETACGITYTHNNSCFCLYPRGNGSAHCIGAAVDINPDQNPMPCQYGDIKNYKPGVDPYSIASTDKIVEIFGKYGFEWGNSYQDYMHFGYLECVSANMSKYGN